jgi:hypothetical protein
MHLQVCPHRSQRVAWRSFGRMGSPSAAAASRRDTVNSCTTVPVSWCRPPASSAWLSLARVPHPRWPRRWAAWRRPSRRLPSASTAYARASMSSYRPPASALSRRAKCPCGPRGPSAGARSGLPRRPCGTKGRRAARRRRRASLSSDGFGPATARRCALSRGRVGRHPRALVGCVSRRGATESAPLVLPSRYIGHREILLPGGGAQHRVKHP